MIERHKKEFTELLRKIEAINIDQSARYNDLDALFQGIEDDYRKIQSGLAIKREDLRIISDILDQSHGGNNSLEGYPLKVATDKAIHETSNYAFFEMLERLIPFNLEKGNCLFNRGRIEEALDAWEEVLRVNPDNEYIHSKLLEIMNTTQGPKIRAEELHRKYHFKYIGSFGHNILKRPIAIVAADYDDTLFVSDNVGNKIHKFNVQGEYLGPLPIEVKNPLGLFKDDENNLWICDFANSRLLAVDSDGNITNEIGLKGIVDDPHGLTHPGFGCSTSDRLYLLLLDESHHQRRLISFNRHHPYDSLDVLPTDVFHVPNVFGFLNNQLYVSDWAQCDLFVYDANQRQFNRIGCQGIPFPFRCFVDSSDGIFLSASRYILKMSANRTKLFTADLNHITSMPQPTPLGLAVLTGQDSRVVFVTDFSKPCIHKFAT